MTYFTFIIKSGEDNTEVAERQYAQTYEQGYWWALLMGLAPAIEPRSPDLIC